MFVTSGAQISVWLWEPGVPRDSVKNSSGVREPGVPGDLGTRTSGDSGSPEFQVTRGRYPVYSGKQYFQVLREPAIPGDFGNPDFCETPRTCIFRWLREEFRVIPGARSSGCLRESGVPGDSPVALGWIRKPGISCDSGNAEFRVTPPTRSPPDDFGNL